MPKSRKATSHAWCFYCEDAPARFEGRLQGLGRSFDLCELCTESMERSPVFLARVVKRMAEVEAREAKGGGHYC